LPGGASSDFVIEEHLDTPMDFGSMRKIGSHLGTGTMIILDDKTCPVGIVNNLQKFFARESCGWCTPCREGLPWVSKTLQAIEDGEGQASDLDLLKQHTWLLHHDHTFCSLAPGAMFSLHSALRYFRPDFEQHILERRCPWRK
jgi:NADH-quinone oxidoreductase subunit F